MNHRERKRTPKWALAPMEVSCAKYTTNLLFIIMLIGLWGCAKRPLAVEEDYEIAQKSLYKKQKVLFVTNLKDKNSEEDPDSFYKHLLGDWRDALIDPSVDLTLSLTLLYGRLVY